MRSIDFYEFTGIVVPGAILLLAIGFLVDLGPAHRFFTPDGIGNAVVYLVLAYVAGHLLQAVGNWVEQVYWKVWKGMPTDWPVTRPSDDNTQWRKAVEVVCGEKCDGQVGKWQRMVRQARSKVYASDMATRVHFFNGNYGMFRGLLVVELVVTTFAWQSQYNLWIFYLALTVAALLTGYRMHHFGVAYARELFANIMSLKSDDVPEVS